MVALAQRGLEVAENVNAVDTIVADQGGNRISRCEAIKRLRPLLQQVSQEAREQFQQMQQAKEAREAARQASRHMTGHQMYERYLASVEAAQGRDVGPAKTRRGEVDKRFVLSGRLMIQVTGSDGRRYDENASPNLTVLFYDELYRSQMYDSAQAYLRTSPQYQTPERRKDSIMTLECLGGYRDAAKLIERARVALEIHQEQVAEEERCKRDPKCEDERYLLEVETHLCQRLEERDEILAEIDSERRYADQVGVVDLSKLQALKERLRDVDESIAYNRANYQEVAGKPFALNPNRCEELVPELGVESIGTWQ